MHYHSQGGPRHQFGLKYYEYLGMWWGGVGMSVCIFGLNFCTCSTEVFSVPEGYLNECQYWGWHYLYVDQASAYLVSI